MKIAKIRLSGFKSFGRETEINLSAGITCLVGPNGCGKSNILDAFLWVLGQRTAHSLRGKVMDDCIFFGSTATPRGSFAEVSLDLDLRLASSEKGNSETLGQGNGETLTITRRHYLNSGSEYYVNMQPVQRLEMLETLREVGFQESSYSFIGQGKIAELLTANPERRRKLMDEAAKVHIPKAKKNEALVRLEQTDQNLLRIQDILVGKKLELEKLEAMAKETRHYYQLRDRYQEIDLALRVTVWSSLQAEAKEISEKLRQRKIKNDAIHQQEKTMLAETSRLDLDLQKRLDRSQQMEVTHKSDQELTIRQDEILWQCQKRKERAQSKIQTIAKQLHTEKQKIHELQQRTAELQQLKFNLSAKLEDGIVTLRAKKESQEKLEGEASRLAAQQEALQKKVNVIAKEQEDHFQRINFLNENLMKKMDSIKLFYSNQLPVWEAERKQLLIAIREMEENLAAIRKAISCQDWKEIQARFETEIFAEFIPYSRKYMHRSEEIISYFFGEKGVFAGQENLEQSLEGLSRDKEKAQRELQVIQGQRKSMNHELVRINQSVKDLEMECQTQRITQKNTETNNLHTDKELQTIDRHIAYLKEELHRAEEDLEKEDEDCNTYKKEFAAARKRIAEHTSLLETARQEIVEVQKNLKALQNQRERLRHENTEALLHLERRSMEKKNLEEKMQDLEQELFNDYEKKFAEIPWQKESPFYGKSSESLRRRLATAQKELREKGKVNLQAQDQYLSSRRDYEQMEQQQKDIAKAKENLQFFLRELDEQTNQLFQKTLKEVEIHFAAMVARLFNGGRGSLKLTDQSNPLESGIEIHVQPHGKRNANISILSGGEQTLGALAFLFALYLINPSPVCFLDEIDANLDDANIPRILDLIKEHSQKTQFIIVTHNRLTIAQADLLIGVTQDVPGLSRVAGLRPTMLQSPLQSPLQSALQSPAPADALTSSAVQNQK